MWSSLAQRIYYGEFIFSEGSVEIRSKRPKVRKEEEEEEQQKSKKKSCWKSEYQQGSSCVGVGVCAGSGEWERMWAPKVVPSGRRQWVRPEEPPIEPHSPQVQWCAECRRKAHLVKMWNGPEEVDELVWNFPRLVCIFVGKQPRRKPQTCKWAYLARE